MERFATLRAMHIADILTRDTTTLSFEFFPPKTDAGWESLYRSIADFATLKPSFVSVTYGAGGSTRDNTHALVVRLRRETNLEPVPHLTCFGHTRDEIHAILELYAANGVSNVLALRGDPPGGARILALGDFSYAADLVGFIKREGERLGVNNGRGFGIGVAGFPEGHSETPPGADLWLTYSMGKEDIWISRIPLPLRGTVDHHIHDTFNDMETGGVVREWNIYSPKYAPVRVVEFPSAADKSIELRDMDPFDFAKAERVFPESKVVRISFRLMAKQTTGRLEIEVCGRTPGNYRPVLVSFGPNGRIGTPHRIHAAYQPETWYDMAVDIGVQLTPSAL